MGAIQSASLLYNLNLCKRDMLDLAMLIEGHPDNVAGTLYGGWVASLTLMPDLEKSWEFEDEWCSPGSFDSTSMFTP